MAERYRLDEFKFRQLQKEATILTVAKRGSGKTVLCVDLLGHYRNIPAGMVISPTEKFNGMYAPHFPDLFVHYEVSQKLLARLLLRQDIMIEKTKKYAKQNRTLDPRVLLLMDDCMGKAQSWNKLVEISEIMMNGRHYQITFILTTQYGMKVPSELRTQFDYIFMLKEDNVRALENLYIGFAGIFPTAAEFKSVFRKCTVDYRCMVIDNKKPADSIQEKVYHYKSKMDHNFKFGSEEIWRLNAEYFDPDHLRRARLRGAGGARGGKKDVDVVFR